MKEFIAYLEKRIGEGREEIQRLAAEGRQDEANFAKVRVNIYDVCRTVTGALENRPGAGTAAIRSQLEKFRSLWGAALERAKQHEDVEGVVVEETKLAALEDVIARFEEEVRA